MILKYKHYLRLEKIRTSEAERMQGKTAYTVYDIFPSVFGIAHIVYVSSVHLLVSQVGSLVFTLKSASNIGPSTKWSWWNVQSAGFIDQFAEKQQKTSRPLGSLWYILTWISYTESRSAVVLKTVLKTKFGWSVLSWTQLPFYSVLTWSAYMRTQIFFLKTSREISMLKKVFDPPIRSQQRLYLNYNIRLPKWDLMRCRPID